MDIAAAFASRLARVGALTALVVPLVACVTDTNRCPPGLTYDPQYDACLEPPGSGDAQVEAASTTDAAPAPPDGGDASPDAAASGDAGDTGLGNSCNADSDCTGQASFCLKDPTAAPTDPGICSIPGCSAAECTSAYSCCDCTAGLLSALMAWPKNVCAPASNKSTLVQFGCTCQ